MFLRNMILMYWINCHSTIKQRPALTTLDQCGIVPYLAGLDFLCIGSDEESVHRLLPTVFLSTPDARYMLLIVLHSSPVVYENFLCCRKYSNVI